MSDTDPDVIIGKILHPIGLCASSIILTTLIILTLIDYKLVNRLTIRLIFTISIADLSVHLSEILSLGTHSLLGTTYCEFLSAYRYFGRLFYMLNNIGISFHLFRSIYKLKKSSLKFELLLWFIILATITIIMVVFGYFGTYSGIIDKIECRPGSDIPLYFKFEEGLVGFLGFLTILISVITFLVSKRSFNNSISNYADLNFSNFEEREEFKKNRKKMALRSFLYPLATLITLPATIALSIMDITGVYYNEVYIALALTQGLSGILTLTAFSLDPALWDSLKLARLKMLAKFKVKEDYEQNNNNNNNNKTEKESISLSSITIDRNEEESNDGSSTIVIKDNYK